MPRIRISETVPFAPEQMYGLVVDVERYPDFLPWCAATRVWDRTPTQFMAEMTVSFKGIRETFRTLDIIDPGKRIEINLRDGPFKYLVSTWAFAPAPKGAQVDFFIDFSFQSRMKEMIMGPVFSEASRRMLDAFKSRAAVVYRR
ncbi:MAG: type II toxin-antitoxin system RatA family toxin [Magnetococcales bacterium]|nr:type II toxin-antitoxin system RatA family toxin [Magnetococcales bacterium]MBF0260203.1 type II toxin-antitoxin system RatA family toxin [Magnetococcales bacterium]